MTLEEYTAEKALVLADDARLAEIDADLARIRRLYAEREQVLEAGKARREAVSQYEIAERDKMEAADKKAKADAAAEVKRLAEEERKKKAEEAQAEADRLANDPAAQRAVLESQMKQVEMQSEFLKKKLAELDK